jgi:hypothetical protein
MADKTTRLSLVPFAGVILGVRYEPQYKVFDYLGDVLDQVLHAEGTPFGPESFPFTRSSLDERVLVNDDKGHSLKINQQDAVLTWGFEETRNLESVHRLATNFHQFVLAPLRAIGIRNIQRYGLVFKLAPKNVKTSPLAHYLSNEFVPSSLTKLQLRFTRRLPTTEGMWRTGVSDYRSVHYHLEETEKGEVRATVDYQEYFQPVLDSSDWGKRSFMSFTQEGVDYFDNDVAKWLKQFTESSAAVA